MGSIPFDNGPHNLQGANIGIKGIVQGVGFRPFVYGLASRLSLTGWVRNTSAGVEIEVDGTTQKLDEFIHLLQAELPPLAQIEGIEVRFQPPNGFTQFEIRHSENIDQAFIPISPDISICDDCLRELFDPQDRRYLYPFINCTNCGPRFTIIKDIPYDRPKTTMAEFPMCPECRSEYEDPNNRRFHAQPIACPNCGPQIWLETPADRVDGLAGLSQALEMIREGHIVAVKGLGGFHLACDATNIHAVDRLRARKYRIDKPFAVMVESIAEVEKHCVVNDLERIVLQSRERPIVILTRKMGSPIVLQVAPNQDKLGIMLPYTPLHYLLFNLESITKQTEQRKLALIMTSGNFSEEPIAYTNQEARNKLLSLADALLLHNRPIHTRCDDSVVKVFPAVKPFTQHGNRNGTNQSINKHLIPLRRSRGYVPAPLLLSEECPPILAVGGELKNTLCVTRGKHAFLSQHIGDLDNFETLRSFEESIVHFEKLFRTKPEVIAFDRHPDYLSTRYALTRIDNENLIGIDVQHHHAHVVSCMAEHKFDPNTTVIGVAFDGTGFGDDGAIWGGEILLASFSDYKRVGHIRYVSMPGGEKAIKEPWRMALSWLKTSGIDWADDLPPVQYALKLPDESSTYRDHHNRLKILESQIDQNINCQPTSSMGRLFDAVAALIGVRQTVNYEAQASIEMESLAKHRNVTPYTFQIGSRSHDPMEYPIRIDFSQVFQEIVADIRSRIDPQIIASRFHVTIAQMVKEFVMELSNLHNISKVVLSGGVWQNMVLLEQTTTLLESHGFETFVHHKVPCNDGGLALGQAFVAAHKIKQQPKIFSLTKQE